MESKLVPYVAVSKLPGCRVLVLAPHPDDEVFGCGGAVMRHVAAGDIVRVVVVSDGAYRAATAAEPAGLAELRREESRQAAQVLGYGDPDFWDFADRSVEYGELLVRRIQEAIQALDAELVYAPSLQEMHPDHRALGMAALEAVRRSAAPVALAMYEVGVPITGPNVLLDISDLVVRKQQAMACFKSQLREQAYDQHIAALNRFRTYTLGADTTAAEAYRVVPAGVSGQDLLGIYAPEYARQRDIGLPVEPADVPLVSVMIRSMDRPTLHAALDSLALQTYPHIEVVVVNAKGAGHQALGDWCGRFPMRLEGDGEALERSQAANLALAKARGKYLIFLDDDDWFAPHHVSTLVRQLMAEPVNKVVYSQVQVVGATGEFDGHLFNARFDATVLMADNLIPINAILFDRCLLEAGCAFDEGLQVYEDWDFWLQVAQHTGFTAIESVGAYYSAGGHSQVGPMKSAQAQARARSLVFEKWKQRWNGQQINALLVYKDALVVAKADELASQHDAHRQALVSQHDALQQELVAQRDAHQQVLESMQRELASQASAAQQELRAQHERLAIATQRAEQQARETQAAREVQAQWADRIAAAEALQVELADAHARSADLERQLAEVQASRSWALTAPMRLVGTKVLRLQHVARLARRFIAVNGGGSRGAWQLASKSTTVLRQYGVSGLLYKVRAYARHSGAIAQAFVADPGPPHCATTVRLDVTPHHQSVAIIVCVHNALADAQRCLESVLQHTFFPFTLFLVDDGSDTETQTYLEQFAASQDAQLIRNDVAKGYTLAANQGLRAAGAYDYAVLLNSDTIVSDQWLDRMVMCAASDPRVGMVGPLSNTASWQSVPDMLVDGDWASNNLPSGMSIQTMARLVAAQSARLYPRIAVLNGFCLLIKRALMDDIGIFDEVAFAQGYGEENDYCLRATAAGWSLAVVDDVYVHHAQSKSYSTERRKALSLRAGEILADKHGQPTIEQAVQFCRYDRVLQGMRTGVKNSLLVHALRDQAKARWEGRRVLFLLPIADAGGGGNVVITEAQALVSFGIDARLVNYHCHQNSFEFSYPNLDVPVIYLADETKLVEVIGNFDAVVATVNTTVAPLAIAAQHIAAPPVLGYYIQDFEPWFYPVGSVGHEVALRSYNLVKDMVLFTKTQWNEQVVQQETGAQCKVIGPSFNRALFRPRPRPRPAAGAPQRALRVVAMIRPYTPRRAPRFTMEILRSVWRKYEARVEIVLFGEESEHPDFAALPQDFGWRNLGKLTSSELAVVFNDSDIFVDFSEYQAMGLTAMEAMSCGVAVVAPIKGGANSFASHNVNALLVDTTNAETCLDAVCCLIDDDQRRLTLQQNAMRDVSLFEPAVAAHALMEALFPAAKAGFMDRS